jgi:hypothetical protein
MLTLITLNGLHVIVVIIIIMTISATTPLLLELALEIDRNGGVDFVV